MKCKTIGKKRRRGVCGDETCEPCLKRSFAYHEKARFWSKINDKGPWSYTFSSNKKGFFQCPDCKHVFDSMLSNVVSKGRWCPYCAKPSKKLCDKDCDFCFKRSFASSEKAQYWSKNNVFSPREVLKSSNKKFKFDCRDCKHSFDIRLSDVSKSNGHWCPYCARQKLCDKNDCQFCFENSFASCDKSDYWSEDNKINPRNVFLSSGNLYKFDCIDCDHSFLIRLNNLKKGHWCPYCANQKLCENKDCVTCHQKSFASCDKAKDWSKNNKMKPRNVFKGSTKKFEFDCWICGHNFEKDLSSINVGGWCPYCANRKLCENKYCVTCHKKSFASCDKAKYWSKNNKMKPRNFFKYSQKKVEFACSICGHNFNSSLSNVNQGKWCPYCSNNKLCKSEECKECHKKSFAFSDMAKYWSKDNKYEPRDVFLSSGKKYKFNCDKCKEKFNMNLDAIKKGSWCPHCKHKTELKLKKWLEAKYVIKTQPRYDWCKSSTTGRHYPFDFSIENLKLIIELDGAQHFQQVSNWKCYKETTKRDVYKMKQAIRNGYTVIRLLQENVYYDQTDWKINLTKAIKKKYYKPSVIFIAECEIYKTHEKLLDNDNAMKTSK